MRYDFIISRDWDVFGNFVAELYFFGGNRIDLLWDMADPNQPILTVKKPLSRRSHNRELTHHKTKSKGALGKNCKIGQISRLSFLPSFFPELRSFS